jgi:CBS-domain-containing membrane protein
MVVSEIARLLRAYRIKRVPVVRNGQIVGIVSRADLLRTLAGEESQPTRPPRRGFLAGALAELDEHFVHGKKPSRSGIRGRPAALD